MMEKPVPEGLEGVCVKVEPGLEQTCVEEPSSSNVCVKEEPSSEAEDARGVSEAAAAALYADHVVKDELIVGLTLVQPRRELCTVPEDEPSCSNVCLKEEPSSSNVCVKEEPSSEAEDARGVSEAAAAALYADHVVKDELIVGPTLVQPRREPSTVPGTKAVHLELVSSPSSEFIAAFTSFVSRRELPSLVRSDQGQTQQKDQGGRRKHTAEKPYKCNHCSYTTARRNHLKVHERTHTGEKPYKCGQCSYASSQRSRLKIHDRMHTGEKPYKCSLCPYSCIQRINLLNHERIHTGEKPYKCGQCSYASSQRSRLKVHERIHTGEKPYQCSQCIYACAQKRDLLYHEMTHADEK